MTKKPSRAARRKPSRLPRRKTKGHKTAHGRTFLLTLPVTLTPNFPVTLTHLVDLLKGYGKTAPVLPDFTTVGQATWDLDVLMQDLNRQWSFAPGQAYVSKAQIPPGWVVRALAVDIDRREGVWHG
jgi:hypothetical protein